MIAHGSIARGLGALLALSVASASLAQIPIRPAGAGGRFQTQHDAKTRTLKYDAATVAAFRRAFDPMVARIEAMPSVAEPGAPMCMRAMTWIEVESDPAVQASLHLLRPIIVDGRCTDTTGEGVFVEVNRAAMLRTREVHADAHGPNWWRLPIADLSPTGFKVVEDGQRYEVMTHGRAPLLRPVTMARYLARRIAELATDGHVPVDAETAARVRAKLPPRTVSLIDGPDELKAMERTLSPADLARPVCVTLDGFGVVDDCPLENQLFEENADYFDRAAPAAVQLIVLGTPEKQQRGENEVEAAERLRIMDSLDRAALRAAIR